MKSKYWLYGLRVNGVHCADVCTSPPPEPYPEGYSCIGVVALEEWEKQQAELDALKKEVKFLRDELHEMRQRLHMDNL